MISMKEAIGRRMADTEYTRCNWLSVSMCGGKLDCVAELIMYWMMYRVKWYLDYLGISKYVDMGSLTPEMFRDFARRLTEFVSSKDSEKCYACRRELVFNVYIDMMMLDIVLRKNGYPSVFKLYYAVKRVVGERAKKGDRNDFVMDYEEFCKQARVDPEKAVVTLRVLMIMFPYGGIHCSMMNKPKYRMPPRNTGFDSLFMIPWRLKVFMPYFNELLEKLPPKIKVVLKPAYLLETGRAGYYVEYNGKPAYTASTKEELMEWLRKHGRPGMFVFKIVNCWEVDIE